MAIMNSRWCTRRQSWQDQPAFFLDDDESKPAGFWLLPCTVSSPGDQRGLVAEGWAANVGRSMEYREPWKQKSEAGETCWTHLRLGGAEDWNMNQLLSTETRLILVIWSWLPQTCFIASWFNTSWTGYAWHRACWSWWNHHAVAAWIPCHTPFLSSLCSSTLSTLEHLPDVFSFLLGGCRTAMECALG